MTTKTTREAKSRLEKFYDERVISFGGKGKKFWVKLYEKDLQHLLEKERQEFIDILENIKRYANGETATSRGQIVEFIDIEAQKLSTFKPKEKTK